MMFFSSTLYVVAAGLLLIIGEAECDSTSAKCSILANSGVGTVSGDISITQQVSGGPVTIRVQLSGFNVTGSTTQHGFHIHQNGSLGNQCLDAGGHYNPTSKAHGAPTDAERHNGDLGNIPVDGTGKVDYTITDSVVTLTGDYSSIGRAIVVHEMEDDLGRGNATDSKTTGHAGRRLGCCTIILSTSGAARSLPLVATIVAVITSWLLVTAALE